MTNVPNDSVFKALADHQRREILRMLRSGETPAGSLAQELGLSPGTVSHHLGLLKAADLVRVRRDGQQRLYALNTSAVEDVLLMLSNLFGDREGEKL